MASGWAESTARPSALCWLTPFHLFGMFLLSVQREPHNSLLTFNFKAWLNVSLGWNVGFLFRQLSALLMERQLEQQEGGIWVRDGSHILIFWVEEDTVANNTGMLSNIIQSRKSLQLQANISWFSLWGWRASCWDLQCKQTLGGTKYHCSGVVTANQLLITTAPPGSWQLQI